MNIFLKKLNKNSSKGFTPTPTFTIQPHFLFSKQYKSGCGGFTLIELMVATALFIVVMMIAMSSLSVASSTNKKAQQLSLAMENVNFAMESMTRSLRMGSNYTCIIYPAVIVTLSTPQLPADCNFGTDGGYFVAFKPSLPNSTFPFIAYKQFENNDGHFSLQRCDNDTTCIDLTSSNVNVEVLKFFVIGSGLFDDLQPSVYIMMKGTVTVGGESESFAIQTIASQRSTEQ